MLTASTDVKGSAGYVAIERVTGTLHTPAGARTGQFRSSARRHAHSRRSGINVTVVPDSGTGQLVGLAGKMTINIAEGKHSFDFGVHPAIARVERLLMSVTFDFAVALIPLPAKFLSSPQISAISLNPLIRCQI